MNSPIVNSPLGYSPNRGGPKNDFLDALASLKTMFKIGPPLFGLYPNGLYPNGLFMIGLSPFGLPMTFGLSPFGLF